MLFFTFSAIIVLQEGVKREVEEETGLHFEPTTLVCVEAARGQWFRFTFTGNITGRNFLPFPKIRKKKSLRHEVPMHT